MIVPSRGPRSWIRLCVALAGVLTAFAFGAWGQPPEEQEDPQGGVKKRIIVEEDPKAKDAQPAMSPDVRLDELVRGAIDEKPHPAIKDFYLRNAVPYDRLILKSGTLRVKPIPISHDVQLPRVFGVQELGASGRFGEPQPISVLDVKRVEYFEEIATAEANTLLSYKPYGTVGGPEGWSIQMQLLAAERLMQAALRYHDYAREHGIRTQRGWDAVRKPLAERLRDVRLLQLKFAVQTSDWAFMRETSSRLMLAYPKDTGVAEQVASARVLEAKRLLASEKHIDHVKARELLDEFELRYPGGGGEPVKAIRAQINALARNALSRTLTKKNAGDKKAASLALGEAIALDPTMPELRELQRELKVGYQTLYVGVRDYPEKMSPSTARLDSEKQVVELLFDGLLAEVPDDGGGLRYRPGTAAAMPAVVPGGREFQLRTLDRDPSGRNGFESHDVVGTLKLLQNRSDWSAYPWPWFGELPTPKDNTTVRISFQQGHPDPRALLTFKLLPARWLLENNKSIDDAQFAERPFGTGPYKLYSSPKSDGNAPREMVFLDNPMYGRGRDRGNLPTLPNIKEIRLVEVAKVHNLIESFQQGSLHILTDVPTAELDKFMNPSAGLVGKVQPYTASANRRIHMLAVNHRRPYMQSKSLRQGLSMAIDREQILTDIYRAGTKFHKPMNGPFPPDSWATPKPAKDAPVASLMNRDLALPRLQTYLNERTAQTDIKLAYPDNDPLAALACKKIKDQVESLFKDVTGKKLTVILESLPMKVLKQRVESEFVYDLAYVPFDYPDDWYPFALGAMLDPAVSERGGRNWMGFGKQGADEQDTRLSSLLIDLRQYREFGQLSAKTAETHKLFNECVPFIPLWQLDRHMLVHKAVKIYIEDSAKPVSPSVLNPTTLFQGIAFWRLEE